MCNYLYCQKASVQTLPFCHPSLAYPEPAEGRMGQSQTLPIALLFKKLSEYSFNSLFIAFR